MRSRIWAAALLAVAGLVAGCGSGVAVPEFAPAAPTTAQAAVPVFLAPARVAIPAIGVSSSLIETGLNSDHTIEVPPIDQPKQASWYRASSRVGEAGQIPMVLLGHIDAYGVQGVFYRLAQLKVGDTVTVTRSDATTATYRVTAVRSYLKSSFPTATVYARTLEPEMRLITCGGQLDKAAHSYLSNTVVSAALAT